MNPQIQEILDRSTNDILGVAVVNQELFARLLIEECAKICFELQFTVEGPAEGAAYQRTLCGTSIKENFGLQGKGPITAKNVK
jgi:hypothetical protein